MKSRNNNSFLGKPSAFNFYRENCYLSLAMRTWLRQDSNYSYYRDLQNDSQSFCKSLKMQCGFLRESKKIVIAYRRLIRPEKDYIARCLAISAK